MFGCHATLHHASAEGRFANAAPFSDHYLYRLQSEIHTILSAESGYEGRVQNPFHIKVESELDVFKRACFTAENEKRAFSDEVALLRQKLEALESHRSSSERRIVCLLDGNGTIFSVDLLSKGHKGGRLAAKLLSESIHYHLSSDQPCHIWTYVFFNRRRVYDALGKAGGLNREARGRFDEFLSGFNQSSEKFVMTDVGNDDEAVVAKVKAHLELHTRSEETHRVVFGACHNTAYLSQLHALQLTSIYREKLVLLPGCTEVVSEFSTLQFPSLVIPNLFIPNKIALAATTTASSGGGNSGRYDVPPGLPSPSSTEHSLQLHSGSLTPPPPPPYPDQAESKTASTDVIEAKLEGPTESFAPPSHSSNPDRRQRVILGRVAGPVSFRPLAQRWTQDHLRSQGNFNSEDTEGTRSGANSVKTFGKQRKINREIPLSQHNPPPCTLFYLAANGCKHGPDCRFGHDYILDDDDFEALRLNAKKVPCPAVNRGESCVFGTSCCYGHTCPFLTRCHYFKQGKCKFQGANMHREEEEA
ncbi:hypothetical protein ACEPAG_5964 [Sanghuangporus baumii]